MRTCHVLPGHRDGSSHRAPERQYHAAVRTALRHLRVPLVVLALGALVVPAAVAKPIKPAKGTTMRVKATAYGGPQPTASGIPARRGICAVDPDVIPLGTRFHVPGYGPCLAADVGPAVQGRMIDVWLLTEGHTARWGVRHLTIRFL